MTDLVEDLNLTPILTTYGGVRRGTAPYDPRMLVAILLYAYAVGVPSSRQIARRLHEDIAFRFLAATTTPDFRTISDFRTQHWPALRGLFVQVLKLCQHAGLVKLGHIALEGAKLKANASKHKAMSYDRRAKEEGRLQAEVDGLLQQATDADARDDAQYGTDRTGDELPGELAFREGRLRKIREAKAALEQEAREAAVAKPAANEALEVEGPGPKPQPPSAVPAPKAQRNVTDPESRIMPSSSDKGRFVQGYNCQAVVDTTAQIIIAADVTHAANDTQQAQPLLQQAIANTGQVPTIASLDAGYVSEENVHTLTALGCLPLIPPDRQTHERTRPAAPHAAHEARATSVRQTQGHGRAGLRSDQAGTWVPAVLAAGPSARPRRMGADLYDPQRAEALEIYLPLPPSTVGLQGMSGKKSGNHGTGKEDNSWLFLRERGRKKGKHDAEHSISDRLLG